MCEVLVVVVSKTNVDDFYKNCMCYKAGDVITVQADGWQWGTSEVNNPHWRILKFPGIDPAVFSSFVAVQVPGASPLTQLRRGVSLDLNSIAVATVPVVAPLQPQPSAAVPTVAVVPSSVTNMKSLPYTDKQIPLLMIVKPLVIDPNAVSQTAVIG